ncbi:CopG family transcriptional regulator [Jiangella asiatica]|uniref:CopG family transcriptional regulator n=1 Tax=Jiangella asiatica TaxID=2530372 RepID=A0A4R5CK80_9ACTN|nr:CopG family transcriptional regulator [Jiangella asiatica]TDE00266.1 CopG family transcriptional regulator [Jiangella asiatica]
MHRTNLYLTEQQTSALDRLAAQEGTSRAEIVRRLLDRALAGEDDDLVADLAAIDSAFGAYRDAEVAPREPGQREDHLAGLWERTG